MSITHVRQPNFTERQAHWSGHPYVAEKQNYENMRLTIDFQKIQSKRARGGMTLARFTVCAMSVQY